MFRIVPLLCLLVVASLAVRSVNAQFRDAEKVSSDPSIHRYESIAILNGIKNNLKEYYYDKSLGGIDLDAKAEAARNRIKSLTYNWEMYRVLAQFLLDFDDSHTFFASPSRQDRLTYGFDVQMIGSECFVTSVTP